MECETESAEADLESRVMEQEVDERPKEEANEGQENKIYHKKDTRTRDRKSAFIDDEVSFTLTEDGRIVPTYKGQIVYREGASMPSQLIYTRDVNTKNLPARENQPADTYDGAVAVFYNSQKGEIILEFKPDSHPVPEFRGKYAPIGGTTQVGESPLETLVRELKEEAPDAYKILLEALIENGRKVDEIKNYVDGVPSVTTVYEAEIKDLVKWDIAKYARLKEGDNTPLSYGQALGMGNNEFAYQSGEVIKNVIRSNLEGRLHTKSPKASFSSQMLEYKPQLYASDIFHNTSPSLIPVRASYNSLNFN